MNEKLKERMIKLAIDINLGIDESINHLVIKK